MFLDALLCVNWITTAVALAGVLVAYRIGRAQGKASERAYQLTLRQATPSIGSRVEFLKIGPANIGNQFRYAIKTTIYNDGSLVASKLNGNWKLASSYSFLDAEEIIAFESLSGIRPIELERDLGYHRPDAWSKPEVTVKVDIDLVFFGFEDKQEKYDATYEFDPKSQKMIQVRRH